MESVEIKSGENNLPAYFVFSTDPYESFEQKDFICNIRADTSKESVSLKYRIDALQTIQEEIADEFREKISADLPGKLKIYIGHIDLR